MRTKQPGILCKRENDEIQKSGAEHFLNIHLLKYTEYHYDKFITTVSQFIIIMKYSILLLNETDPQAPERNQLKIHSFSLTQFTPPPSPTITFSWRKIDEYLESQLYSFYVAKNIVLGSLEEFHTYVI